MEKKRKTKKNKSRNIHQIHIDKKKEDKEYDILFTHIYSLYETP